MLFLNELSYRYRYRPRLVTFERVSTTVIYDQFGCSGFIRFVFGIHESRDVEAVDHLLVLLAAFELTVSTFLLKDISDMLLTYCITK